MAIRVKVATADLIASLEARVKEGEAYLAEKDKLDAEWKKLLAKHAEEVRILAQKGKWEVESVSSRGWSQELTITYKLPKGTKFPTEPERPKSNNRELSGWQENEVKNSLKLLKMSSEPFINTSAYKDVVSYL